MKRKSGLSKFNTFLSVVLVICIVATAVILAKSVAVPVTESGEVEDVSVIDAFAAGTYGGKEFSSEEDVINYYVDCYNYTKTLTAEYDENGESKTYYKLVGEENLTVNNILIEGKPNQTIENLVPGILGGLFSGGVNGLSPSGNRNPDLDKKGDNEEYDCRTSALTPDDVLAANVSENEDGTISITIQPKAVILSMPMEDAQGHFFNTLGDISSVVESISILSFTQGTIQENFVVNYMGGTGTVTIDPKTGEILDGEYIMKVHVDVKHACVAVLKDKSAALDITYTVNFPASDEYLMNTKGIKRK